MLYQIKGRYHRRYNNLTDEYNKKSKVTSHRKRADAPKTNFYFFIHFEESRFLCSFKQSDLKNLKKLLEAIKIFIIIILLTFCFFYFNDIKNERMHLNVREIRLEIPGFIRLRKGSGGVDV